ncbi:MAG: SDR family NAD(P)-dependent oxidoreductase [Alphaproteobacteria bacterium]|nr:SDR family NAD(P)-dependent oxidoreductase [Alphaproteobacteria bacterium]
MKELANKVAFVTGAASGIGLGIATALAQVGVKVMLADIEKAALDKAVESLKRTNAAVDGIVADVSLRGALEEATAKTIERFGKVHILVNNAGIGGEGLFEHTTPSGWDWVLGVNLMSVINGFQIFVPLMREHGEGGHIVSTASMAGVITAPNAQYQVTKHGVVALSESVRGELGQQGIGVSVLCPGFIRTNILDFARNVPSRYQGKTNARPFGQWQANDAVAAERLSFMQKRINEGIDPLYVGDLVREGIEDDVLYIFTDTEFEPLFDARVAEIKKGFDRIRSRKPRH